ncbi:histidine phosphatase family protein [Pontibacter sp. JH31]|uniref:Histidine phosphatase family protein n=1 Tax=Pontibacter aquaedesilientis TaxID=2766980 RepID=A0ABR7XH36_9BACT|nr:phosphoglycerate mutase family protein [Pontibacter aquaedesilientis]MBD1396928.1 histidine phosphatase family protein [Pontibacter aquaedesilientis]
MKHYLRFPLLLLLLVGSLFACRPNTADSDVTAAAEQKVAVPTTVYLVRHAEKDISNPSDENPDLTLAGKARAEALRSLLDGEQVHALYATKYIRTINTLKPLAEDRALEIRQYGGHDFNGIREKLLQEHRGQTVVIAGHSNTLLPMIEALGAKRPVSDIADSEYNYVFKLTIDPENKTTVELNQFGG